jgi:biopolymer transport protein ExbB/TolQ
MKKLALSSAAPIVSKRYGTIETGIHHYITPPMALALAAMVSIITLGFEKIREYFMHGPVLNGLMLVVMTINNNLGVYRVARFLKRIELVQEKGLATEQDVQILRASLERKAHLLSLATFSAALENLHEMGHLNIHDADARLIKSKFGARISHMRGKVNYLSGILVMLGLIGTFWGLLGTISSVGQAMGKISDNFALQAAAGGDASIDMGGFLQSIAKPLEGMGIGFSASLFGLTGSLFLGFFNFLSGHAQNRFIENFGRWIDDCIPTVDHSFLNKMKESKVPNTDELKGWIAGFVYLANKTNQQLSSLLAAFAKSSEITARSLSQTEKLNAHQQEILQAIEAGNQRMQGIQTAIAALGTETKTSSLALKALPEALASLAHSVENQTALLREAGKSRAPEATIAVPYELHELTTSVTRLLDELRQKNDEALLAVFTREEKGSIDKLFDS